LLLLLLLLLLPLLLLLLLRLLALTFLSSAVHGAGRGARDPAAGTGRKNRVHRQRKKSVQEAEQGEGTLQSAAAGRQGRRYWLAVWHPS